MGSGRDALEAELGGPVSPGLAAIGDEQLRDLAGAVARARRRQAAEIAAAGDKALSHLPRLLRIAVKKVVG